MSKLFILGTGFSKAVSCKLPTMKDLGEHVQSKINELPGHEEYEKLISDPNNVEVLLTYLYQDMPWETASQLYLEKSAFLQISQIIADYITDCEKKVFEEKEKIPGWTEKFVSYLHENEATIATFNYDTIIECLSLKYLENKAPYKPDIPDLDISNLYNIPLTPLHIRTGESTGGSWFGVDRNKTYKHRLLKLHGSANWYYSEDMILSAQQVYYSHDYIELTLNENLSHEEYDEKNRILNRSKTGLSPLIIPPVADKNLFYNITLVKTLWRNFYKAVEEADEIYCIGYSLPQTDLSTRIFFSAVMDNPSKKVYLVNLQEGSADLINNYRKVLKNKRKLFTKYISDNEPIKQFVEDLVNESKGK